MRINRFESMESFFEYMEAGKLASLTEVVTVIDSRLQAAPINDDISIDIMTACKKPETAINRLFKAAGSDARLEGWKDCIIEAISNNCYTLSEVGQFAFGVEYMGDDDKPIWYAWLNIRLPKSEAAREVTAEQAQLIENICTADGHVTLAQLLKLNGLQNVYILTASELNNMTDAQMLSYFESLTAAQKQRFILESITYNHDAKMKDIISISTSAALNSICQTRSKDRDSICAKCYANALISCRKALAQKLRRNYIFYTNIVLTSDDIPYVYNAFGVRFESFGDLQNIVQAANYVKIAQKTRLQRFTIWAKNVNILEAAITSEGRKPDNLAVIESSPHINAACKPSAPCIDATFTVWEPEAAKAQNVNILCGGRACKSCQLCYKTLHKRKACKLVIDIPELLK